MKKVIGIFVLVFVLVSTTTGVTDDDTYRDIHGFLYFSYIYGDYFEPVYPRALINLGEAMKKYTNISVLMNRPLYLSDPRIVELPFLYLVTDEAFELTTQELENLQKRISGNIDHSEWNLISLRY